MLTFNYILIIKTKKTTHVLISKNPILSYSSINTEDSEKYRFIEKNLKHGR